MPKLWSVAVLAAVTFAASTSPVDAQNAAVHAMNILGTESRAVTGGAAVKPPSPNAPAAPVPAKTAKKRLVDFAKEPPVLPTPKPIPTANGGMSPTPNPKKPVIPAVPVASSKSPGAPTTPAPPPTVTLVSTSVISSSHPPGTAKPAPVPLTKSNTWVESQIEVSQIKSNPNRKACYRRVSLTTNKVCLKGYTYDGLTSCWSQCPLDYPVQCGFECLPQNKDCTMEFVAKASAIATTALSIATHGVFGALLKAASGVKYALACGQGMYDVADRISTEVDRLTAGKAMTNEDQFVKVISNLDLVIYDIPIAIATCMGTTVPKNYTVTKNVTKIVQEIVVNIVQQKIEKINPLHPNNFINFFKSFKTFLVKDSSVTDKKLPDMTVGDVVQIAEAGLTCGGMIKSYFKKVQGRVEEYIKKNPTGTSENLVFAIFSMPLILEELPKATVNCWKTNAPDGAKTRDEILTSARLITEQIVKAAKDGARSSLRSIADYKFEIAQFALDIIAHFEPYKIAELTKEFLMPICPVSEYMGVIERGTLDKALGLETVSKAFQGSTGTWETQGDGYIYFRFKSSDTKEIKLNIMSGGKKVYEWPLKAKQSWQKGLPLTEFAGKTLYIDRWRPGILNFMGTGGGSLLMWVPENTKGRISIDVIINPTQIGDR